MCLLANKDPEFIMLSVQKIFFDLGTAFVATYIRHRDIGSVISSLLHFQ